MDKNAIFTPSVIRGLKLRMTAEMLGKEILRLGVLSCCEPTMKEITEKCAADSFKRKNPYNGELVKVSLFPGERIKAKADDTGETFDITFLFKILSSVEADQPQLHLSAKAIKDKRNSLLHKDAFADVTDFETEMYDLETIFLQCIDEIEVVGFGLLSRIQHQDKVDEISKSLSVVRSLKQNLRHTMDKIKNEIMDETIANALVYLNSEGQDELNQVYESLIFMNPVEFFVGTDFNFSILDLYAEPEFMNIKTNSNVSMREIMDTIKDIDSNLVIEGSSGVGKSTFLRYLMAKRKYEAEFKDVFMIHFDCKNSRFSSISSFISDIMPKTSYIFGEETLVFSVFTINPIFIIDSIDDMNDNSYNVVLDIISRVRKKEARMLASSRPGGIETFLHRISGVKYDYFSLNGICSESKTELVTQYYSEFSRHLATKDIPEKDEVINNIAKMHRYLGNNMKSPLILCLITYLLINKTNQIESLTSVSSLYETIIDALLRKLKTRILDKLGPNVETNYLQKRLQGFSSYLCEVAFDTLLKNETIISEEVTNGLAKKFSENFVNIKSEEALSLFFVSKGYITEKGYESSAYSFPHKSFQEFLAAKAVHHSMKSGKKASLEKIIGEDIIKNESFLLFITGIVANEGVLSKRVSQEIAFSFRLRRAKCAARDSARINAILQECSGKTIMIEAISKQLVSLYIDERDCDMKNFALLLRESSPSLKRVTMTVISDSEATKSILSLLKWKNIKLTLIQSSHGSSTLFRGDNLLKYAMGGRCTLYKFTGCLGKDGIQHLWNCQVKELELDVSSSEDAEGLTLLAKYLSGDHDGSSPLENLWGQILGLASKMRGIRIKRKRTDVETLYLHVRESSKPHLPAFLPTPSFLLKVTIENNESEEFLQVLNILKRVPRHITLENMTCRASVKQASSKSLSFKIPICRKPL